MISAAFLCLIWAKKKPHYIDAAGLWENDWDFLAVEVALG